MEKLLLLVDDEPSILKSLKRLFHYTEYTVLTANCAYQALDIIREKPVAVLVSDYTMPGLSGAELLAMAKSLRPDIYAVILSGNNDQQSVIRSINEGGAAKFITKPWTDQDLIATVDEAYETWLNQHYSLQIPGLLNQNSYQQQLQKTLCNPYLNDYILICLELQDLRNIRHQLSTTEWQSVFRRLFEDSRIIGDCDRSVALLDDGRISACLKQTETDHSAEKTIKQFLAHFPELITFRGYQLPIRFNVGFSESTRFCHNGEQLLKNASIALNHARDRAQDRAQDRAPNNAHDPDYGSRANSGPSTLHSASRIVRYEHGMAVKLATQLSKTSALHHALERNEFSIVYQPKIQVPGNRLCGAEALLRWSNPALGNTPPDEFIPLAEEYGLINEIGDWVLNSAASQWTAEKTEWKQLTNSGATLSINVSSIQLADPQYISRFALAITNSRISPSLLELEVTETALIKDMKTAVTALAQLRELGVKVSIDDFGTGYSSLSYLNKLPIDIIKIDRSFIGAMFLNSSGLDLVRNLICLGQDLGLDIVAEGVEEQKQLDMLYKFGCDTFQGYYFSPPLPAHQFESFVRQSKDYPPQRRVS